MILVYISLIAAVILEVIGDSCMKLSNGFARKLPLIGVVAGYALSFLLLSYVFRHLNLGIAYALWNGLGIILTMVVGVLAWKEELNARKFGGLVLILAGIVVMHLTMPIH